MYILFLLSLPCKKKGVLMFYKDGCLKVVPILLEYQHYDQH